MRKIEENMFHELVKKEVVKEMGFWIGSVEQNREASYQISKLIKSSFKSYERNRKPSDRQYFCF